MAERRVKKIISHSRPILTVLPKLVELDKAILYNLLAAKQKIYVMADKLRRGLVEPGTVMQIVENPKPICLPEKEEWDFALGDTVKIRLSRNDFEWMQKQTAQWLRSMNHVHGLIGIVIRHRNKYQNVIGVYFTETGSIHDIYADALEKVSAPDYPELRARWKPGDCVKLISCKAFFCNYRTAIFDELWHDVMGKRGRVVAVHYHFVFVTFNEFLAYPCESYWLARCYHLTQRERKDKSHPSGFVIGEKAKVTSNMKTLIENEKRSCGWKAELSSLLGATVTVVGFHKILVCVQAKYCKHQLISPKSLRRLGEKEDKTEGELDFVFGDIVTLVLPKNSLGNQMAMNFIPNEFIRYLKTPAVVSLVRDDYECVVKISKDVELFAHRDIITKAIKSDQRLCIKFNHLTENLAAGDSVHLDVGPPSFVRAVITDFQCSPKVKMALTESAVLEGYVDPYHVIIKYNDGTKFRIKKEYLTVPDKFFIKEEKKQRKAVTPRGSGSQKKRHSKN